MAAMLERDVAVSDSTVGNKHGVEEQGVFFEQTLLIPSATSGATRRHTDQRFSPAEGKKKTCE